MKGSAFFDRRRRVVPHRHVERLRGDVFLGAIRHRPFDAGRERLDDRGMEQRGLRRALQSVGQRLRLFGDDVETEDLDRDETIARGLIGSEYGTESANTYLVQHPEGAEGWRRRECARVLSGQRRNSSGRSSDCNTNRGILGTFRRV